MKIISQNVLHAIHYVFPPPIVSGHNVDDPFREKHYNKEKVYRNIENDFRLDVDEIARSISLPNEKVKELLAELKSIVRKQNIPL